MNEQISAYPVELLPDTHLLKHVNSLALMPVIGGKRITLLGRRIFNVLLHRAQSEGIKEEYEARMHEILADSGYNSNNTALIRKTLKELMSTTVEWQSPSLGEIETWDACNLLSGAGTTKNKQSNALTIRWSFGPKIRAQLLGPDRFARISIQAITQLSTHAAIALYEICARYVDNPGQKTARQHWRWWKPVLTGVAVPDDDKKAEYRFFKRDVLTRAIAEINAVTNLEVKGPIEFRERDNWTISDIQFSVRIKGKTTEQKDTPLSNIEPVDLQVIGRGINSGVSQKTMEVLFRKYGTAKLTLALQKLEARLAMPPDKVGLVLKPNHLLKSYIERDLKANSVDSVDIQKAITNAKVSKLRAEWAEEWLKRRKLRLLSGFKELGVTEETSLLDGFREYLAAHSQPPIIKRFEVSGWDHKMVRETFLKFYGNHVFGSSWNLPSIEDILEIAAELAFAARKV